MATLVLNVSCTLVTERYTLTHPFVLIMERVLHLTPVNAIMDTLVINVVNGIVSGTNVRVMERVMHPISVGVTKVFTIKIVVGTPAQVLPTQTVKSVLQTERVSHLILVSVNQVIMVLNANLIHVLEPCTINPLCVLQTELVYHQMYVRVTAVTMDHNVNRITASEHSTTHP